jgi:hypothetical protein
MGEADKRNYYKFISMKRREISDSQILPRGVKDVLKSLLSVNRLGGKNICWPSQEKIAKDTKFSKRQVIRHLTWLKERGILSFEMKYRNPINGKPMKCNVYDLSNILNNSLSSILKKYNK